MNEYELSSDLGFHPSEFELISQYLHQKKPHIDWKAEDFEGYVKYVVEIREQIKAHSVAFHSYHIETSHSGLVRTHYHTAQFQYSYQRYDLMLLNDDWLKKIYHVTDPDYHSDGLFVKSGMSAFLASSLTLKRLYADLNSIHFSRDGYFEINDMFSYHLNLFQVGYFEDLNIGAKDIVILDSTAVLPEKNIWMLAKIILIDTTCWEPSNPLLCQLLEKLKAFTGLIILVRSHIKLDCFGLEVNRLGSIVILKHENSNPIYQTFKDACHETICNVGCNFNIDDCYPWLFDPKFHALNKMRTNRIKYYTNKIYQKIATKDISDFTITKGQHDLFIKAKFKRTPKNIITKFKLGCPILRYARHICSAGRKMGLPILPATSFGLCYTTVDGHRSRTGTEAFLRLAPSPNMNEKQAEKIADFFIEWFSKKQ
jgi:hypothetical protein